MAAAHGLSLDMANFTWMRGALNAGPEDTNVYVLIPSQAALLLISTIDASCMSGSK